jgi:hypothetical protein
VPYGIYDLAANSGWVSVGVDHDTAAFAVNSLRQWWQTVGRARYPEASRRGNKIEHRLFSFISQNWRATPLVSYRVIVELISATTTKTGLTVRTGQYPSGIVVSDAEMAAINIKRAEFHGEWNYTISPNDHPPNRALIS